MATMMHIFSVLVAPKSANVEKVLVFKAFVNDSMVQNAPDASAADLTDGWRMYAAGGRALAIRSFEYPKGHCLGGLAASRAAARFMGYRRFRRPPSLGIRRSATGNRRRAIGDRLSAVGGR